MIIFHRVSDEISVVVRMYFFDLVDRIFMRIVSVSESVPKMEVFAYKKNVIKIEKVLTHNRYRPQIAFGKDHLRILKYNRAICQDFSHMFIYAFRFIPCLV